MKKVIYSRRTTGGFTLIEVMIAAAIFGMALLTAFVLMSGSLRWIRSNREQAYIARVMESTLENVRNLTWVELTAQPATQTFDATKPLVALFGKSINTSATTELDFNGTHFSPAGTINIEEVAGEPDLRRITVKIQHAASGSGGTGKSSLATLISKNGIDRR